VDLRDFESIVLFLSEEEIDELQAAIDERRMERLAREGKDHRDSDEDLAINPTAWERPSTDFALPTGRVKNTIRLAPYILWVYPNQAVKRPGRPHKCRRNSRAE